MTGTKATAESAFGRKELQHSSRRVKSIEPGEKQGTSLALARSPGIAFEGVRAGNDGGRFAAKVASNQGCCPSEADIFSDVTT